jgi:tetratricopeptide (TPR) repeat protein
MKDYIGYLRDEMRYFIKIILAVIFSIFLFAGLSRAEKVTFVKEYTYQASEIDSKVTARAIAVEQVKRLVLDELGTYLMAETEVKDFRLTKDKVVMLTAGIVQTEILNEKWDGERYYLKARIKADPNEVAAAVDKLRKDTHKSKELEDVKKKADEAFKEIERLKGELEVVKADKNKQKEYAKAANTLSATDWFEKGISFYNAKKYDKAIKAYSKAIELDPYDYINLTNAYIFRGFAYGRKGQYDRAFQDFNKVIELNPNHALAYNKRGFAYKKKGQYDRAIEDYNKEIELEPNAYAYIDRGDIYAIKGQYDKAILDFSMAIELEPNDAHSQAYYNRGVSYGKKGQHDKAIKDIKTAAHLGYIDAQKFLRKKGIEW